MRRRSTFARPGLIPYLQVDSPSPFLPETLLHSPVTPGLKAEASTVSYSSSSFGAASKASFFDVVQISAACPRPWHLMHSSSVHWTRHCPFLPHLWHLTSGVPPSVASALLPSPPAAAAGPPPSSWVPFPPRPCRPRRPPFPLPRPPPLPWAPPPARSL